MICCFSIVLQLLFIPAVHSLVGREGICLIYKPLGNLTDVSGAPLPTPGHCWARNIPGDVKI